MDKPKRLPNETRDSFKKRKKEWRKWKRSNGKGFFQSMAIQAAINILTTFATPLLDGIKNAVIRGTAKRGIQSLALLTDSNPNDGEQLKQFLKESADPITDLTIDAIIDLVEEKVTDPVKQAYFIESLELLQDENILEIVS